MSAKDAIAALNVTDEIKTVLLQIQEEILGAAQDRLDAMKCKNCKHWTVPTWDTKGMGTCYLNSHLRDEKKPQVFNTQNGGSLFTHETFGCVRFQNK